MANSQGDKLDLDLAEYDILSKRDRRPNPAHDDDVLRERLVQQARSRGGHASNVTRKLSAFNAAAGSADLYEAQHRYEDLDFAFRNFRNEHRLFMQLAAELEPQKARSQDEHFMRMQRQMEEARETLKSMEASEKVQPDDSASQTSAKSSTASARARAAAEKAALLAKQQFLQQEQQLQFKMETNRLQREIAMKTEEIKLKMELENVRLEAEISAASAREEALSQVLHRDKCVRRELSYGSSQVKTELERTTHASHQEDSRLEADGLDPQHSSPFIPQHTSTHASHFDRDTVGLRPDAREFVPQHSLTQANGYHTEASRPRTVAHDTHPQRSSSSHYRDESDSEQFMTATRALVDQLSLSRLPIPEPGVFTGDVLKYPAWRSSFKTLIESRGIPKDEAIHYLKRYVGGDVKEVVEGYFYIASDQAYIEAMARLESRFGDPFQVANAFRDKLEKWPKVTNNDSTGLRRLADFLEQCQMAMTTVDGLRILDDEREMRKVLVKLPDWLIARWGRRARDYREEYGRHPPFGTLTSFLQREADIACDPVTSLQALKMNHSKDSHRKEDVKDTKKMYGKTRLSFKTETKESPKSKSKAKEGKEKNLKDVKRDPKPCLFCQEAHLLNECSVFGKKDQKEKEQFIVDHKLCFACLKPGHMSRDCRFRAFCKVCSKRHPTALHRNPEEKDTTKESPKETSEGGSATAHANRTATHMAKSTMIVPVWLGHKDHPKKEVLVYALLDTQSDTTFVTESVLEELQVAGERTALQLSTMTVKNARIESMKVKGLQVRGLDSEVQISLPDTFTRDTIPVNRDHIPTPAMAEKWDHLQEIMDHLPPLHEDADICILIGYDCPKALAPREVISSVDEEPFAIKTDLGWSIVGIVNPGNVERDDPIGPSHVITCCVPQVSTHVSDDVQSVKGTDNTEKLTFVHRTKVKEVLPEEVIQALSMDFQERKPIKEHVVSQEDKKFVQIMEQGVHQTSDGFYELPLPFRDRPKLPDNRLMAEKRLMNLKKKFQKDDKYQRDYKEFIQKIIQNEEAEEVPAEEIHKEDGSRWYIPHHGVYHPKKPDKIRVVFDCSARCYDTALNDHLLQGPDYMNNLTGVLSRFRKESIAVTCDIERMFHRFKVNVEDRDYLRFLWWPDGDTSKPVKVYRMKVHIFGAKSSPACANFALKQLAKDNQSETSDMVYNFITRDFYVDDGLHSSSTVEEAVELSQGAREVCQKGNIRLHKFASNSREVMEAIPMSERSKNMENRDLAWNLPVERTLGVEWNLELDNFQFCIALKESPVTRRSILSSVASVYDPLGFLAPVILVGKRILQQLCIQDYAWDDPVPEELQRNWVKWKTDLIALKDIKIPRCYKPADFGKVLQVELHHFSDASSTGFGQCSYIRQIDDQSRVHCALVMAKARVVPRKIVTIPRLELSAAVLSVQISQFLKEEIDMVYKEYFYTDSRVVLGYIANEARKFHVFVANRVERIRESSSTDQWRHIRSEDNPADLASRGADTATLADSNWFRGPDFLWNDTLPDRDSIDANLDAGDPEVKAASVLTTQVTAWPSMASRLSRFSDLHKAKRAVALIMKFTSLLKKKAAKRHFPDENRGDVSLGLTVRDLRAAEAQIMRWTQGDAWRDLVTDLQSRTSNTTPKSLKMHGAIHKLDPYLDNHGVIRIGGRLKAGSQSHGICHPVLLPKKHHVTTLVIRWCHERVEHQGRGISLNEIRSQGFWIVGGISAVSGYISRCVKCRKLRSAATEQKMADLPQDRLSEEPPFTYCGVDCFGPFLVKQGRKEEKRYGVMFTCLSSRATHIEVATSLSTDAFINSLRRLICLRGPIRLLRSDRGTNFVGAKNELKEALKEMDQSQIERYLQREGGDLEFRMNVPSASHMGGVWERQIRTARSILDAMLDKNGSQLTDESLRTLMYEVTAIMNSRPLTAESLSDPSARPLSPNDILTMKTKVILPPPGLFPREDLYARKHWRRVQHLANQFWNRFQKEYLQSLQARQKWTQTRRDVAVKDIVLMKDENAPRCLWRLARVTEVYPDGDGHVRKVKLVLPDGQTLERPVQKLVMILMKEEQD